MTALITQEQQTRPRAITADEYQRRRRDLMASMAPGTVALVPAATLLVRNRDTDYKFRQHSDFWYLTGFGEANAVLALAPEREEGEVLLFCDEPDERRQRYFGEQLGPEAAPDALAVDKAFPLDEMDSVLPDLLEGVHKLYVTLGERPDFERRLLGWIAKLRRRESAGVVSPSEFIGLSKVLHEQRLIKSAAELRLMEHAANISVDAMVRVMRCCRPSLNEMHLEAELRHAYLWAGAGEAAYPPIIGSGANACVLHYMDNDAPLRDGDLVLVDAGCEYEHYAADLTRTFPVGGRFSGEQLAVYEIVLEAQRRCIAACRTGAEFMDPHEAGLRAMIDGLVSLGLLAGSIDSIIEEESYLKFCPHKTSHFLGLDVHDVGSQWFGDGWRQFAPGMVLTVEPGLYIPPGAEDVDAKWLGIGVRIEDDILIGEQGPKVLTEAAPKEIADIEATMRS